MFETRNDILIWVAGRLDKRGSFEDYLLQLCRALRQLGLRTHVVAGPQWDGILQSEFEALGVGMTALPDQALRSPVHAAKTLLRTRPYLLHYHFGSPSSLLAALARGLGVRRFVFTDHGSRSAVTPAMRPLSLAWLKRCARQVRARLVDLYLPVSNEVAGHLRAEIGLPLSKVRPLMNGIDLCRFRPIEAAERDSLRRRLFRLGPQDQLLLFAGQLTAQKGVLDLLAIQAQLLARFPALHMAWAGAGPLRANVDATAGPRVHVLGRRGDVAALLQAADLIVVPSRWREAFALILAEAAACGVPAVASAIGGIPEVVANRTTGILVPPGDADALLGAIAALVADPDWRRVMGAAARARAEAMFDLNAMIAATIRQYERLLPRSSLALTQLPEPQT